MLGLGQSLSTSSLSESQETFSYSKSTIESSDGWSTFGIEGSPTIQYDQTAPDSSTGWLKLTFDQSQTNFWALTNTSIMNSSSRGTVVGATATISHDVYLDNAARWGDNSESDDDVISWGTLFGNAVGRTNVAASSAVTVTETITATSTSNTIQFRNGISGNTNDLPLAGASVYIKNIIVQVTYP